MYDVLDRFRSHLEARAFFAPDDRILIGYSGGADSACLVDLTARLRLDVVAAHLHHGLRAEADREQALCEAFCRERDVPFVTGKADVPRMMREQKLSEETAGRDARYAFFRQAAFETGCRWIATAHTRDDHVETTIMRIARGTGLAGLAGIPERRDEIVRPLLPFSRAETRGYAEEQGLWWHDDPSNDELAFARARIRARVLPELRAIHPAADEAIVRLAEIAREEDRFLDGMAAAALEGAETPLNGPLGFVTRDAEIAFDRTRLDHLPRVLFRRAIRLAYGALGASVDRNACEVIADAFSTGRSGSHTAEGGAVVAEWSPSALHVRQARPAAPFRYPLTVPGDTISDEFGWMFTAEPTAPPERSPRRDELTAWLNASAIRGPLYFRTVEAGDSMRPAGFDGKRKASDLLGEAHLTAACRARLPIVCDMVGPIWIPGVCVDDRVRLDANSPTVLRVEFKESESRMPPIGGNV